MVHVINMLVLLALAAIYGYVLWLRNAESKGDEDESTKHPPPGQGHQGTQMLHVLKSDTRTAQRHSKNP